MSEELSNVFGNPKIPGSKMLGESTYAVGCSDCYLPNGEIGISFRCGDKSTPEYTLRSHNNRKYWGITENYSEKSSVQIESLDHLQHWIKLMLKN